MLLHNSHFKDGRKLVDTNPDEVYVRILSERYANNRPGDNDLREVSKISLWRSIWHAAKGASSLFGVPAYALSDEQRSLIGWSRLYDNIAEAHETPDKAVLEDNDLLDGWLITQHKKRDEERKVQQGEKSGSRRNGAQEVFIPAETAEDAARIEGMNDAMTRITKKQRLKLIEEKGRVSEQHMPDSQQAILMQATQAFHDRMRNRS
jgi:hypothetical protein